MDEQQIEAALRAEPPDEPTYQGDIAGRLRTRATAPDEGERAAFAVEVFERAPHRRRSWPALAGAAAAVVVLVIGLVAVARPDPPPSATTPTTNAVPSSSLAPGSLPIELVDRWVGSTPSTVITPNRSAPAFVVFSADQVTLEHLSGGIVNDFTSRAIVTAPGQLLLTLADQAGRCVAGATGDYRWAVSPKSTTLTLEAVSDECPDRAAALAGTWTHTACPSRGNDCLGRLEAGRYASVNFDPFDSDSYAQLTYAVPDGWSSTLDDKSRLTLLPPDGDESGMHGVYLFADVAPTTADCPATSGAGAGMSAIADALTASAGLSATTTATSVAGYEARTVDLSAATPTCDGERPLLTSGPGGATSWTLAIGEGQQMRIVLIDLPNDRTMAVVVASDRSTPAYAALVDASTAVIDSIALSPTP
jgi:hypothetical protein